MSDLPEGWTQACLGEIAKEPEQYVPAAEDSFAYVDIGAIDRTRKSIQNAQQMLGKDAPSRARKKIAAGDTLVSMTRPNLNAVALVPEALDGQIASTGFDVLRPENGIDPRWLAYVVRTDQFVKAMSDLVQGALYPAVRSKDVRGYIAALAPAAEQTRIADQLDTLLARIQACNERLDAIPALLKRFRGAVLDAAITGHLSRDWRESFSLSAAKSAAPQWAASMELHKLPPGWRWARFAEFIENLRSGTSAVPGNDQTKYPVLRSSSVRPMDIDLNDVRYLASLQKVRNEDLLCDEDLLLTRLSGSLDYVANCVLVRGLGTRRIYYPDRLFRARLKNPQLAPYAELCFSSPLLRKHLTVEAKSSAGHQRISMSAIRDFPIPLPGEDEQRVIVERVELLLHLAKRIGNCQAAAAAKGQQLAPLTLSKAFRGELAPQDPDDEPASTLLARIAAQRSVPASSSPASAPRRGHPPRAPKETAAMTKSRQDDDVMGRPYLAMHLRRFGTPANVDTLFKLAELPVADFYKQLAWEVAQGHVNDNQTTLESGHAAG